MGEYYRTVNLDKHQYISGTSLGLSVKLSGVLESPLSSLLVWLLAEGKNGASKSRWLGAWARDRIVVAGDEGAAAEIWEATHNGSQFTDITIPAFEEYVSDDIFKRIEYWQLGFIDSTGTVVPDSHLREELHKQRENMEPPEHWF